MDCSSSPLGCARRNRLMLPAFGVLSVWWKTSAFGSVLFSDGSATQYSEITVDHDLDNMLCNHCYVMISLRSTKHVVRHVLSLDEKTCPKSVILLWKW